MTEAGGKIDLLVQAIPFATRDGQTINWWDVHESDRSGDFHADIETGQIYARIALAASREDKTIIPSILASMIEGGKFEALEAGFVIEIGSAARAGGQH